MNVESSNSNTIKSHQEELAEIAKELSWAKEKLEQERLSWSTKISPEITNRMKELQMKVDKQINNTNSISEIANLKKEVDETANFVDTLLNPKEQVAKVIEKINPKKELKESQSWKSQEWLRVITANEDFLHEEFVVNIWAAIAPVKEQAEKWTVAWPVSRFFEAIGITPA